MFAEVQESSLTTFSAHLGKLLASAQPSFGGRTQGRSGRFRIKGRSLGGTVLLLKMESPMCALFVGLGYPAVVCLLG